jgi:hypothetical protein
VEDSSAIALSGALAFAPSVSAKRGHSSEEDSGTTEPSKSKEESPHTISWWCVDMNDLFHADVPVVVTRDVLEADPDAPFPTCSETSFPVTVPAGSSWTVGLTWYANKTYPDWIRDALADSGYDFVDANPIEDLMKKIVQVRIVVRDFVDPSIEVAEFTFDPRMVFRRFEIRRWGGASAAYWDFTPFIPAGITSVEELGRLPTIWFPGIAGPVEPGSYRAWTYWTLSAEHNDGLGLEEGSFLPAGEFVFAAPRFIVAP